MIVETGYSVSNETLAEQVMTDLFSKTQALSQCAGIFYWEPELYGWWKPAYYTKLGWNAYGKGAFTSQGRPGKALNAFQGDPTGISRPSADPATNNMSNAPVSDLQGRSNTNGNIKPNEIHIIGGRKVVKR